MRTLIHIHALPPSTACHFVGFCYFGNVAIAAKHAIATKRASRVIIFDLDIHHGNGTQGLTYDDPNIFYLSIHRASNSVHSDDAERSSWFYPGTGSVNDVGKGDALGTNLNIVWEQSGMGNSEYAVAMTQVVEPAIRAFKPDLILVSAGLDAAEGDLLGDCKLTPDAYYAITNSLLDAAGRNTPLVVALEGGYNLDILGNYIEAIALALLDEPWKEDEFEYEEMVYFSSQSILPQKKTMALQERNPYSLNRYLDINSILLANNGSIPRPLRHAISTTGRTARAFARAKHRVCMKSQAPFCHGRDPEDLHIPLKKRNVRRRVRSSVAA